jgi:hypothetical protein
MSDIQRYDAWPQDRPFEDKNGEFVTYEDHIKIVKELEAKLAKAMIALKFYADLETYEQNAEPPYQNGFCAIELDEGKIARAALAEIEGETHE